MQASPNTSAEAAPAEAASPVIAEAKAGNQTSLVRNTLYLTLAQVATVPIGILTKALLGHYLGPEEFGYMYLAGTLCAFALPALEWGQQGAVPALVARDRGRAGAYLGSSLAWRALMGVVISLVLAVAARLLGYNTEQRWAVALTFPVTVLISCAAGFKDTIRGFERTDLPALAHVGQQFAGLLAIVPVLLLGGHLRAVLLANVVVMLVVLAFLKRALRSVGVLKLDYEKSAFKSLFGVGTPFVFFDLAMVALPTINGVFLGKMVPAEVAGWYGVSQSLIGNLIFPASALIGALYPTLCRLQVEDQAEFAQVSRNSLYGTALLAVPAAVGCGMFPEIGVAIFGGAKFGGAADHLRVMSLFVFLVYFSMPLGTAILASNRQRAWALVQSSCLVVSLVGNPFLIPYFQRTTGNGAIGTCITLVLSEALVVASGIALAPRRVWNGELLKSLLLSGLAGVAMALVAFVVKPVSLWLAVPAALGVYGAIVWFSGAVQPSTAEMIKRFVRRKLLRRA